MSSRPARLRHVVLPLARPQYVSLPEALSSALVWSRYERDISTVRNDGKSAKLALMYDAGTNAQKELKTLVYRETRPDRSSARLLGFSEALSAAGLECDGGAELLASAVGRSILGLRSTKSPNQPAAPISEALALLQNNQGFLGAAKPPRMDRILQALFDLGTEESATPPAVAELWLQASDLRLSIDPVANAIDQAARSALIDYPLKSLPSAVDDDREGRDWAGLLDGTPYSWFQRSWTNVTSDEWVKALPARVWVDWASTVLRMAIGLGFLWESLWYERIARSVLSGNPGDWEDQRRQVGEVLPWKASLADVAVRDVSSVLLWRVRRSNQIKTEMGDWIAAHDAADAPFQDGLSAMAGDAELRSRFELALVSQSKGSKNLWESIKYSLSAREEIGPSADHYGLLRTRAPRFLLPAPGTEWMAVVSSLCMSRPGGKTNLGVVMASLRECGLKPEMSEVIALLERAGLARGSADADEGVVVESAF